MCPCRESTLRTARTAHLNHSQRQAVALLQQKHLQKKNKRDAKKARPKNRARATRDKIKKIMTATASRTHGKIKQYLEDPCPETLERSRAEMAIRRQRALQRSLCSRYCIFCRLWNTKPCRHQRGRSIFTGGSGARPLAHQQQAGKEAQEPGAPRGNAGKKQDNTTR